MNKKIEILEQGIKEVMRYQEFTDRYPKDIKDRVLSEIVDSPRETAKLGEILETDDFEGPIEDIIRKLQNLEALGYDRIEMDKDYYRYHVLDSNKLEEDDEYYMRMASVFQDMADKYMQVEHRKKYLIENIERDERILENMKKELEEIKSQKGK